jgi:hypothetical protein
MFIAFPSLQGLFTRGFLYYQRPNVVHGLSCGNASLKVREQSASCSVLAASVARLLLLEGPEPVLTPFSLSTTPLAGPPATLS